MASRSPTQIAMYTAGFAAAGVIGYAVYFDYMRRHSADFRKGIKKQHKKIAEAAEAESRVHQERMIKQLSEALIEIQSEVPPISPEQQEAYFQEQVSQGERLAVLGPDSYVDAASHFYRALRVYPAPTELLNIYQKVVPEPILVLILQLSRLSDTLSGTSIGARSGGIPPAAPASLADLDDSSPAAGSPKADSAASGASWEKVDEAA